MTNRTTKEVEVYELNERVEVVLNPMQVERLHHKPQWGSATVVGVEDDGRIIVDVDEYARTEFPRVSRRPNAVRKES